MNTEMLHRLLDGFEAPDNRHYGMNEGIRILLKSSEDMSRLSERVVDVALEAKATDFARACLEVFWPIAQQLANQGRNTNGQPWLGADCFNKESRSELSLAPVSGVERLEEAFKSLPRVETVRVLTPSDIHTLLASKVDWTEPFLNDLSATFLIELRWKAGNLDYCVKYGANAKLYIQNQLKGR